jgi:hypothetical protein
VVIVASLKVTPFHTSGLLRSFSASVLLRATRPSNSVIPTVVVPDARQLKPLHLASNLLILNHRKIIPFTANPLFSRQKQQTLNQRVQGSSPCAPTS